MPARYEAMRDKFMSEGMDESAAKTKAAKIYNGTRKQDEPVLHGAAHRSRLHKRVREGLKRAFPNS